MSFSGQQAQAFFGPLTGKTATFLLEGRQANLEFARAVMGFLSREAGCAILDLDAFYSSNSDSVLSPLTATAARSTTILVPEPGSDVEGELSRLFEVRQAVVIVDSLNSLYHLLSQEDGSARSRKLTFAVAALSYLAKTNDTAVILTMYRREGFARSGTVRSISGLSDVTATVDARDHELTVRSERGSIWPGGRFATRNP